MIRPEPFQATFTPEISSDWRVLVQPMKLDDPHSRSALLGFSLLEPLEHRRLMSGGALDPTFGNAGKARPGLGFRAVDMTVQADGKTLALGRLKNEWVVARLDLNGALDRSFGGGDGLATVRFDGDPFPDHIAIQPGGKIVVAGTRGKGGAISELTGADEFVLARFRTDGSLDPTFGSDGKLVAFSGHTFPFVGRALAIQPDGKILLAAGEQHFHFLPTPNFEADFFVGRLNADGSKDKTFGLQASPGHPTRTGFVHTDMGGFDLPSAIAIQPDGKIVVGGTKNGKHLDDEFGKHEFLVARYTVDGRLDKSFDGNGKLATDMAANHIDDFDELTSIIVQPDGKIIAGGLSRQKFALVRYNVNGSIDSTFAGGRVFTDISGGQDVVNSLLLDPRGNITAVGTVNATTPDAELGKKLAAVQYLPNGLLDRSFGNSGIASFETGDIVSAGAARAPGGKIVVAGAQNNERTLFLRFAQETPIVEMKDLLNNQTTEGSKDPAAILIKRDAAYDFPTRVFLDISGPATEGLDYTSPALHRGPRFSVPKVGGSGVLVPVQLEGFRYFVDIPAGADFVVAEIFAKADSLREGDETIHWAPIEDASYQLGPGNAGHVTIHEQANTAAIRPGLGRARVERSIDSLFSDDRIDALAAS
jgi:uncharacterized delta-60 repeat protein